MGGSNEFQGFPRALPEFFRDLGRHNDRAWFEAHRRDYEACYLEPARAFVAAMAPRLAKISKGLRAEPRINGSIQRINRDTRFSTDKTPYKTALLLQFPEGEKGSPGLYVHIDAETLGFGAGAHVFTPAQLDAWRRALCDEKAAAALEKAITAATRGGRFSLSEPDLKRVPRGFDPGAARADLLRHKSFFAHGSEPHPAALFGPRAVDHCLKRLEQIRPVQAWLVEHFAGA